MCARPVLARKNGQRVGKNVPDSGGEGNAVETGMLSEAQAQRKWLGPTLEKRLRWCFREEPATHSFCHTTTATNYP